MPDRESLIAEVERYWLEAGLSRAEVAEMKGELATHLDDAASEGRRPEDVIGDRASFAESWAAAQRGRRVPAWEDVKSGNTSRRRASRRDLIF